MMLINIYVFFRGIQFYYILKYTLCGKKKPKFFIFFQDKKLNSFVFKGRVKIQIKRDDENE